LADEISCDTCRLWDKTTGESLDKDVFRFDKGDLVAAYREVAKRIVPEIFKDKRPNWNSGVKGFIIFDQKHPVIYFKVVQA